MSKGKIRRSSSLLLITSASLVAASTARAAPPVLYDVSPETVIVNLDAGQTSFECTGFAFDPDSADTVSFFALIAPFMTLDVMPGNPGSFRIHAENLTGEHYGGYFVDVVAYDGHPGSSAGTRFAVSIEPEPSTCLAILGAATFFGSRSRSKSHV